MSYKQNLYLICKMDCERVARYAPDMGGPKSWDLSEKSIEGWASLLLDRGFKGFFGIHPETAFQHRDLFFGVCEERLRTWATIPCREFQRSGIQVFPRIL